MFSKAIWLWITGRHFLEARIWHGYGAGNWVGGIVFFGYTGVRNRTFAKLDYFGYHIVHSINKYDFVLSNIPQSLSQAILLLYPGLIKVDFQTTDHGYCIAYPS